MLMLKTGFSIQLTNKRSQAAVEEQLILLLLKMSPKFLIFVAILCGAATTAKVCWKNCSGKRNSDLVICKSELSSKLPSLWCDQSNWICNISIDFHQLLIVLQEKHLYFRRDAKMKFGYTCWKFAEICLKFAEISLKFANIPFKFAKIDMKFDMFKLQFGFFCLKFGYFCMKFDI